jgi:phosphatidylglycerophosphatase A
MPAMSRKRPLIDANSAVGRMAVWVATGLGIGFGTRAPGTVGGLWGLALVPVMDKAANLEVQLAFAAGLLLVGVVVCDLAARALGEAEDPQPIVLDEIVVLPIVFIATPALSWMLAIVGFLLFRLFDITKPGLVRRAERLPGGLGIVADDALAAALAWATLQLLLWVDGAMGWQWLGG